MFSSALRRWLRKQNLMKEKENSAEQLHLGGKRFSRFLTHKICHKVDSVEGYCHQPLINIQTLGHL